MHWQHGEGTQYLVRGQSTESSAVWNYYRSDGNKVYRSDTDGIWFASRHAYICTISWRTLRTPTWRQLRNPSPVESTAHKTDSSYFGIIFIFSRRPTAITVIERREKQLRDDRRDQNNNHRRRRKRTYNCVGLGSTGTIGVSRLLVFTGQW